MNNEYPASGDVLPENVPNAFLELGAFCHSAKKPSDRLVAMD